MRTYLNVAVRGLTLLVAVSALNAAVQAALVLEFDYRASQNASYVAGPASPTATLQGSATVNTAGAAVSGTLEGYIVNPKIQTGFMDVTGVNGGSVLGATWGDVFGTANNFDNGTIVTVMKPDFGPGGARRYFWGQGADGNNDYITMISQGRGQLNGGRGTENAFNLFDNISGAGNFPWDTNTWYMVATTWQQSSGPSATPGPVSGFTGLPDGMLRMYIRALQSSGSLTPDSTAIYAADEAVAVWNPRLNTFGSTFRQANRASFTEGGIGDYALFQYYDTTFSQGDFDNLFDTFIQPVPEPSTWALLAIGAAGMIYGGGRRRKQAAGRAAAGMAIAVALVLGGATDAPAALVAQMSFESVDTGATPDTTPIVRANPANSNLAEVVDGAVPGVSILTGPTGLSYPYIPELQNGIFRTASGAAGGLRSVGSNGELRDYTGASANMGSGAVFMVFNPNFNGVIGSRNTFFSHNVQGNSQVWFLNVDGLNTPYLRLRADSQLANIALPNNFVWDTSKWYALGASWTEAPAASLLPGRVDVTGSIYARVLDGSAPTQYAQMSFTDIIGGAMDGQPYYLGRRSNADESANGDMSLFRLYNEFFDQAGFDAAFNSLQVPEPSTSAMLMIGSLALAWQARRRSFVAKRA